MPGGREQLPSDRVGLPGRLDAPRRRLALLADQHLHARLDRHLRRRRPASARPSPLRPAGHASSRSSARRRGRTHRCRRSRASGPGPHRAAGCRPRSAPRWCGRPPRTTAPRPRAAVSRPITCSSIAADHLRGTGRRAAPIAPLRVCSTTRLRLVTVGRQLAQPVADRRDSRVGQQPVGVHFRLGDGEQRRAAEPALAHHLAEVRGYLVHRGRRHPVEHDGDDSLSLGCGAAGTPTGTASA